MQFTNFAFALQVATIAAAAAAPLSAAQLDARKLEVDVQQSNYCLPSNLNCPYHKCAPNKEQPEARAKITQDEYHYKPGGKRSKIVESVEKRDTVKVDFQQSNYCLPSNLNCPYKRRSEESVDKREPVKVDVQQSNYCLPSNLNYPYKKRDADV